MKLNAQDPRFPLFRLLILIADLVDFINIVEALRIEELFERKIQRQADTINRRHIQRFLIL